MESFTEKELRPSWKYSWHLFLLCILIVPLVMYKAGLWWLWLLVFGILPVGYAAIVRASTHLLLQKDEITLE